VEKTTIVLRVEEGAASLEAEGDAALVLLLAQFLRARCGLEVGVTALVPSDDSTERVTDAEFRVLDEEAAA
jgi:hypothetical protein